MNKIADVIICVYNGEAFIEEALQSLLADPASKNLNILCLDDGSGDGTADIVSRFDGKISLMREPHRGIAAARNKAVQATKNPYIVFFDADDLWIAGRLKWQLNRLEQNANAAAVCFGGFQELRLDSASGKYTAANRVESAACPGTAVITRACFDQNGYFNETLETAYFMDWYSRLKNAGVPVTFCEEPVIQRRIHKNNSGILKRNHFKQEHMQVLKEHLRRKQGEHGGQ